MVQHELRIHYGAPSLVSDDARWRTLAINIANFEARSVWRISPGKDTKTVEVGDVGRVRSTSIESDSENHVGKNVTDERFDIQGEALNQSLFATSVGGKRKHENNFENLNKVQRNKRTTFARTKKGLNPVFKNPVATYPTIEKQGERTPHLRDENSVPQPTVLVPFTRSPKLRRTRLATTNNQKNSTDTSLSANFMSSRVRATSFDFDDSSATEILDYEDTPIGTRDIYESPTFQTQIIQEEISLVLYQTSLDDKTTLTRTTSSVIEADKVFEELHHDSSSITQSFSVSTESPSQVQQIQTESSPLAHRSVLAQAGIIIDLTDESVPKELTRRDILGPVSSPVVDTNTFVSPSPTVSTKAIKTKLLSLRRRIYCSASANQFGDFQSFLPESLKELSDKFGLVHKFRPVQAVNCIKNGDRGYWKMLIRITSLVLVAKSRRSPLSSSQWSDEKFLLVQRTHCPVACTTKSTNVEGAMRQQYYPSKCPTSFTPWTLEEFIDFWALLRKTIEKGRAGYDVHATIADNMIESNEGVDMEVRFYGYAEALSHMWCILYVLSNKKAAYMPMQWMGPGQGMLVRMSGQPKCGGSIGRWIELEPGIQGSWGLENSPHELDSVGEA